jgi:hypothetical protein
VVSATGFEAFLNGGGVFADDADVEHGAATLAGDGGRNQREFSALRQNSGLDFHSTRRRLERGVAVSVMRGMRLDTCGVPGFLNSIEPMKRAIPFLIAAALASGIAAGEPRTWTSADGKQLQGEFVKADKSGVTVRTVGDRQVLIPLNRLSDEDWLYAGRMAEEQAAAEKAAEQKAAEEEAASEIKRRGPLKYSLSDGSDQWPEDRRQRIVAAMDEAVSFLNLHGDFKKQVTANNSPGTPTADANFDGWINWGGSISRRVALHEIAHTLGIGTHPEWQANIKDGKWTGRHAIKQLREFDGPAAVLYADRMHFWPYGLNFDQESSPENDLRFVKMLTAFRKDLGIR